MLTLHNAIPASILLATESRENLEPRDMLVREKGRTIPWLPISGTECCAQKIKNNHPEKKPTGPKRWNFSHQFCHSYRPVSEPGSGRPWQQLVTRCTPRQTHFLETETRTAASLIGWQIRDKSSKVCHTLQSFRGTTRFPAFGLSFLPNTAPRT